MPFNLPFEYSKKFLALSISNLNSLTFSTVSCIDNILSSMSRSEKNLMSETQLLSSSVILLKIISLLISFKEEK